MRLKLFVAAVAMLSASLAARGDTYTFTFGSALQGTGSFALDPIAGQSSYTLSTGLRDLMATYGGANITFTDDFGPTTVTVADGEATGLYSIGYGSNLSDGLEVGNALFQGTSFSSDFTTPANHYDSDSSSITFQDTSVTPEPSSVALFGTGLLGIAGLVRERLA